MTLRAGRIVSLNARGLTDPQLVARFVEQGTWYGGRGGYVGARKDRRETAGWVYGGGSANAELLPDLPELRDRSLELERNAPIARGALSTVTTSVIGRGLRVRPEIDRRFLGLSDKAADAWERQAEGVWLEWARGTDADVADTLAFAELEDVSFYSELASGDCFAIKRHKDRGRGRLGFCLQLVEAHRVGDPSPLPPEAKGKRIAGGVEHDQDGAPVAYWIADRHPRELAPGPVTWRRVPAVIDGRRMVLHLFRPRRPGLMRGEPYRAPVIEPIKQLARYTDAELMAAVVSAMFTVFVRRKNAGSGSPLAGLARSADGRRELDRRPKRDDGAMLGNGAVVDLDTDEEIEIANPGRPNDKFDPFFVAIVRQIGVALELPFEILIKHFTASYSASQAALLLAWQFFRTRRAYRARRFNQPCYEEVITEAVALGRLAAPGFLSDHATRQAYLIARWDGDAPGHIDPGKTVKAYGEAIDRKLTTLAEATSEWSGGDWERNLEAAARERRRERELEAENGEPPAPPPGRMLPAPALDPDDDPDKEPDP